MAQIYIWFQIGQDPKNSDSKKATFNGLGPYTGQVWIGLILAYDDVNIVIISPRRQIRRGHLPERVTISYRHKGYDEPKPS
jgi:hypothetical protein